MAMTSTRCRASACLLIWVTRGIKGFPRARSGRADWNWILLKTVVTRLIMRLTADTMKLTVLLRKAHTSRVRESSLWVSIRDCLTPADILVLRTAGTKWNNSKLYGAFGALWFFLMTKIEVCGPARALIIAKILVLVMVCSNQGRLRDPDRLWRLRRVGAGKEETRGVQSKTSPVTCVPQHVTD